MAHFAAVRSGDFDRIGSAGARLVGGEHLDIGSTRADYVERAKSISRSASIGPGDVTPVVEHWAALMASVDTAGATLEPGTLETFGPLLVIDQLGRRMGLSDGLSGRVDRFFLRQQVSSVLGHLSVDQMSMLMLDVVDLLTTAPRKVSALLSDLADDRFQLTVTSVESDEDRIAARSRARLISASIALIAVALVATGSGVGDASVVVQVVAYVVFALALIGVAVLWLRSP